jgi:acetyl esterase/lipase
VFDLDEAKTYHALSWLGNKGPKPQRPFSLLETRNYHSNKKEFDSTYEVECLFLSPFTPNQNVKTNKIIVYIHGGGFCMGSSRATELYLRKVANETGVPIFSIDYRLAPKNPYPDPVNDCYQAYVWICEEAN